jgi:hypothetical protein
MRVGKTILQFMAVKGWLRRPLLCLALGAERGLEVLEEAASLHELSTRHSLGPLAERIGRDVSWVSRRLSLYGPYLRGYRRRYVPDECLYMGGTRIMVPLARANGDHTRTLLSRLEEQHTDGSTARFGRSQCRLDNSPRSKLGDDLLGYWIARARVGAIAAALAGSALVVVPGLDRIVREPTA